jgi:hypothetical protein
MPLVSLTVVVVVLVFVGGLFTTAVAVVLN